MNLQKRLMPISLFLLFLGSWYFFYVKYVPLVKSFQSFLVPILLLVFFSTSVRKNAGILIFVFCFPLVNNLPYFFGIHENIPHAPVALVLFIAFFLGWLVNTAFSPGPLRLDHPIFKPILLLSIVIIVSGTITFFRHANFYPFASDRIHDLIVNSNGVTAGGAIFSTFLNLLNYITGFLFFLIIFNSVRSKKFFRSILIILAVSFLISLAFSFIQIYQSSSLGNTPFWVGQGRINGTFKDPNSFGAFLSSFVPVLLGLFFFFEKKIYKGFFLVLILFALFVFPFIGSRSGLVGLVISVIVFVLLLMTGSNINLKRKLALLSIFCLILGILSFYFFFFGQHSKLYKRIGWSLDMLSERDSIHQFFTRKLDFWNVASHMIKDYPFTGVGVGSFIVELPNYSKLMDISYRFTDSAENYFFQQGAELGLIGLGLSAWLFVLVFLYIFRVVKKVSKAGRDKYVLYGLAAATLALFINYIVHSYIGSFEIKYFFWLLVALILSYPTGTQDDTRIELKSGRSQKILAACLIVFFAGIHLWNSTHTLSIGKRHEKVGWEQSFGLYKLEKDDQGVFFHWTKKTAGFCEKILGSTMIVPIRASHPDLDRMPAKVKVYSANRYFRKQTLLKEIELKDSSWTTFELPVSEHYENNMYIVLETDRIWQPLKSLGVPDPRWLAVGLGKIWYEYPGQIDEEEISESLTIPNSDWVGEFKEKLWKNGVSRMKFEVDHPRVALQLDVRVNTAFGWGPYLLVKIDGRIFAKCMINVDGWNSVILQPEIEKGEHTLGVEYTNDIHDPAKGENRNVYLGDLKILYLK
jgi:O-antigen ligase